MQELSVTRTTTPSRALIGLKPARYVPWYSTDIRKTFEKFRRLQRMRERQQAKDAS